MRKGLKRLVTIIFVPHSQRSSYNLRIPLAIFYSLILLFTGTIIFSGLFVFKFRAISQTKRAHLELLSEVAKIRETMTDVRGLEAKLKVLTGSSRETEIATGGPSQENPQALMEERFLEREERSLSELEKGLEGERMREASLPSISPVEKGWIISKSLEGLEIASLPGSVVRATAEGKVLHASGGKVIIDHGNNLKTEYENLEKISIKVGENVKKGETIGYSGGRGISYQVGRFDKEIDPLDYISDGR
ncbi:M23 family metallopeptidase [bacterium]|nr:M23 family metallopeptidase [bacterium]